MGVANWLKFFEDISKFYQKMFLLPLWQRYPNYAKDMWNSLLIFLEGYAFERQGRHPDYPYASVDALLYCKQITKKFSPVIIDMVWKKFKQLLHNQKINPKNNPLYPSTNPDNLKHISKKPSVIEIVIEKNMKSLVSYLQDQIETKKDIQPAFDVLTKIRGVGNKIASFYLRDLVVVLNMDLTHIQNRHLLQPVDIWVERIVKLLANLDEKETAKWIVINSINNGIKPELVNMGMWFFGSQVVASEYKLKKTLTILTKAKKALDDYVMRFKSLS